MSEPLPTYSEEQLRASSVDELMRLLKQHEDRLPKNVIEASASLGEPMLDAIAGLLEKDYYWGEDQSDGEWWRLLHAVMILGLMDSQRSGELLVAYMRRIDEAGDDALQEWLSGYWAAFYRNKPEAVLPLLRELAGDDRYSWHVRGDAATSEMAWIAEHARDRLDATLDRAARMAFARHEDFDLRLMLADTLRSYARLKDRRALEQLADAQSDAIRWFGREDIVRAYARGGETPEWENYRDPWSFYDPEEIEGRRQARLEDAADELDGEPLDEPYVREQPKVGRNDPCPCGSGKKYKKCCGADA